MKWPPDVLGGLFFDAQDHLGLEYWYEEIQRINGQIEAQMPKMKK